MKPVVAIVGRPNVGKSVLFNRLVGRRKAITGDEPGVTRDLNYADVMEEGKLFTLVDTGGFEPDAEEGIMKRVREQARLAIEDSDVIILVMDGRTGPTPQDRELVGMLRRAGKPVIYGVNKLDTPGETRGAADEFYSLGIDRVMPLSAEHGLGVDELLDDVLGRFDALPAPGEPPERVRIAIVGRPNAGKSSLLNRLVGKERAIVSEVPGTTRDTVDSELDRGGKSYLFIDTAGIKKKRKITRSVEIYSVRKAVKSIDRCDVALLVIDGMSGVTVQDEKIARLVDSRGRSCVIVVNKWDMVEKDTHTTRRYSKAIREKMPFLSFAPVLFVSAMTGQRVDKVLAAVDTVAEHGRARVTTSRLNELVKVITEAHSPPLYRGRRVKFYYATQAGTSPPTFVFFSNWPEAVPESYRRYLASHLRESLGLVDVPIRVFFRKRR
jgi:GTP-binding protein